jgi:putative ABC transport system permease protein
LTVLGVLLVILGVFGSISSASGRLSVIGLGAAILFLGVAFLSPQLVVPLANVIGWPVDRFTRVTGRLARENAVRSPSRTAVTAAALMIGLALVAFVTIFAEELRQTANNAISREIAGDFAIYNQAALIPKGVAPTVARVPGVGVASALSIDDARIAGIGAVRTNGIEPGSLPAVYRLQWTSGSPQTLARLGPYDALISDTFADDHHLRVGSRLEVTTTAGKRNTFSVAGIYRHTQILENWCVRYDTLAREWRQGRDRMVLVAAAPGVERPALQHRLDRVLKTRFPTAAAYSQQDIKDQSSMAVNQLLALIYILLAMSVLVSLFGIINTLVLSIYERTREIGMLRAIGTTRSQIRWIVRWESVITAVIGAVLGLALGIVLAALVTAGLKNQELEFVVPVWQLLGWLVFAIVFGIVAAAWPARRAARMDVLQAVAYE